MAELNLEEILLTGFARLPEKSVLFSKYNGTISVTLLVNRSSGKILEVASEDFSPLQINYFNKLLRGEEISTEDGMFRIEQLLARIAAMQIPIYAGNASFFLLLLSPREIRLAHCTLKMLCTFLIAADVHRSFTHLSSD